MSVQRQQPAAVWNSRPMRKSVCSIYPYVLHSSFVWLPLAAQPRAASAGPAARRLQRRGRGRLRLLAQSGGASGIRDLGLLESALSQPKATFDGTDLHPTVLEKAAALGFALVANHAFVDGNKRIGHAAMEVFLVLNGVEIDASTDEQERLMIDVAAGQRPRDELADWLRLHSRPIR